MYFRLAWITLEYDFLVRMFPFAIENIMQRIFCDTLELWAFPDFVTRATDNMRYNQRIGELYSVGTHA